MVSQIKYHVHFSLYAEKPDSTLGAPVQNNFDSWEMSRQSREGEPTIFEK